jgi:hypothetical protein
MTVEQIYEYAQSQYKIRKTDCWQERQRKRYQRQKLIERLIKEHHEKSDSPTAERAG